MELFVNLYVLLFMGVLVVAVATAVVGWTWTHAVLAASRDRVHQLENLEQELRREMVQLQELSTTDALTGVGNRRYYEQVISACASHAVRANESLAILLLDLNKFKSINDTYGHLFGDMVLKRFAECISRSVRPSDVVCRLGGDEYVVILSRAGKEAAAIVARRIVNRLAATHIQIPDLSSEGRSICVTTSIGVASISVFDEQVHVEGDTSGRCDESEIHLRIALELYRRADVQLYQAKQLAHEHNTSSVSL
jgi:diguanylate cyclase (GGDEF)-like protein